MARQSGTQEDFVRPIRRLAVGCLVLVLIPPADQRTAGIDDTLAPGETGELCTRGYSVMRGYWDDADRTAEAIDAGKWMHTGDLATMDGEGYFNIVGRIKDMVIRGGENLYR